MCNRDVNDDKLIEMAKNAREMAYTPYSDFKVGSALLTTDGKIFTGCNIENSSFSPTICAERTAIFKAISEGSTSFTKIVVITGDDHPSSPCGVCLQVLSEFVDNNFEIILTNLNGDMERTTLIQLLGRPFRPAVPIGKKRNE